MLIDRLPCSVSQVVSNWFRCYGCRCDPILQIHQVSSLDVPYLHFTIFASFDFLHRRWVLITLATEATDASDYSVSAVLSRTTLGNLGSSIASCGAAPLTGDIVLNCNYGVLQEIEIFGQATDDSSCDDFGADLEIDETNNCNHLSWTTYVQG